jgi:hypothetical protein
VKRKMSLMRQVEKEGRRTGKVEGSKEVEVAVEGDDGFEGEKGCIEDLMSLIFGRRAKKGERTIHQTAHHICLDLDSAQARVGRGRRKGIGRCGGRDWDGDEGFRKEGLGI